jgi:RNA polymerase sigma factor (TIGR02999 family)
LLSLHSQGDATALDRLTPLIYDELHRMAVFYFRREPRGGTLQPTALVHEAFLRLVGARASWENRAHFFAAAAQAMRRVLIDRGRARRAVKRGGRNVFVTGLDDVEAPAPQAAFDVLDIDRALRKLAAIDERQGRIVELRVFAGLEIDEIGEVLGISGRTVKREWRLARAFLMRELAN